ncbi:hypothetical protein EJ05DRAFT_537041 [Pseudovirgaria hyperparasitica]|uniref:Uncharacterized protein n=1 Tax=Pseudovirgaria hyperparasitica TaxID=470096 RepID=A0A6A6WFC1_9PEZI|nr:uncharacterized protein EJ05DRAFT_537041 [Pseudovirgaria hyperparasitica]KAF2759811.1 hypothetical protein EJ05DRAFT_537041 [Pseudovirgaria hyperparasitica]
MTFATVQKTSRVADTCYAPQLRQLQEHDLDLGLPVEEHRDRVRRIWQGWLAAGSAGVEPAQRLGRMLDAFAGRRSIATRRAISHGRFRIAVDAEAQRGQATPTQTGLSIGNQKRLGDWGCVTRRWARRTALLFLVSSVICRPVEVLGGSGKGQKGSKL